MENSDGRRYIRPFFQMPRRCNSRIVHETAVHVGRSHNARAALDAAEKAARSGRCAEMHKHAQRAREILNLRG